MEFDKSKILTCVTADQLKEGQLGWINDTVECLKSDTQNISPYEIFSTNKHIIDFPFTAKARGIRRYFYPAPEPTYAERQAEWVKEHNVAIGTKVRITRAFSEGEDGIAQRWHESMGTTVGKVGVVERLLSFQTEEGNTRGIRVDFGDCQWWYPYFTLEVIQEPTYRPYNNDELNDLVGEIVRNKQTGYRKLVTGKPTTSLGVNLEGEYINAKDLLNSFMMDDGKSPCGIKE